MNVQKVENKNVKKGKEYEYTIRALRILKGKKY